MVSFNGNGLESEFNLMELNDANILRRFDVMSPQDFVRYLAGPLSLEERGIANRYLFGLVDDINRVNAVIDFAEKSSMLDDLCYE